MSPSRRRNPILADIFSRLKYMERRGSGFKKIVSAYKGHDGYIEGIDPTFSTPWDSFVLTLPKFDINKLKNIYDDVLYIETDSNNDSVQGDVQTTNATSSEKSTKSSEKSSEKIFNLIKQKPTITVLEIATEINMSPRGVEKQIRRLRETSIIKRVGADRGGYWEIINNDEK